MLERISYLAGMKTTRKKHPDLNELAAAIVAGTTEEKSPEPEDTRNPAAVALGRLGGLKGGPARKKKLSHERRKEIAQKAAQSRWHKKTEQ